MIRSFNSILIFIGVTATIFVVLLNEYNIRKLKEDGIAHSELVQTADDLSYRLPPENFLRNGLWKDNRESEISYVMRPPGYGSVILLSLVLAPDNPILIQKLLQILFFFISVLLLGRILFQITKNKRLSVIGTLIFSLIPCFSGFVYYSITEAFTPMLILWLTFLFLKIRSFESNRHLIYFILVAGLITITRVQLIVFPIIYLLFLILNSRKYLWALASFIPLLLWQYRVQYYTGSFNLHPIYSENNLDEFRPPHEAMTNLFRIWEYRSDNFHSSINTLSMGMDSTNLASVLAEVPDHLQKDVKPILFAYQSLNELQDYAFKKGDLSVLKEPEKSFIQYIRQTTKRLACENIVLAYIITPSKSLIQFFNKSYLNLYVFQKSWRGHWAMEIIRTISFIIILFSFIAVLITVMLKFIPNTIKYIAIAVIITLLYLIFVQRLNEERYLVPLLPIALILLISLLHGISIAPSKNQNNPDFVKS